jgi:hypothetical protein
MTWSTHRGSTPAAFVPASSNAFSFSGQDYPAHQPIFKFSPFYAILEDGLERMSKFVKSDSFTFVVNGEACETTVAEAVLFSPKVDDLLRSDPTIRAFEITDDGVNKKSCAEFLRLVYSRDFQGLTRATCLSYLSLCRFLGNERLSVVLLASLASVSTSDSPPGSGNAGQTIQFKDADIDSCASRFYSYPVDALQRLDRETLHRLFKSRSLRVENEDKLLNSLIELGSEYLEFWHYVEVGYLTRDGIELFLDNLSFEEVTVELWSKVVDRLKGVSDGDLRSRRHRAQSKGYG